MENLNEEKEEIRKNIKSEIEKHSRALKEKINKFLSAEKPSDVLIIKAHLICEYYLNQILIVKNISNAQEIDKLGFYEKVNKALNIQNHEEKKLRERLIKLNKLRNKVGHELEYILSEFDVDSLGYLTGKEYILSKYDFDTIQELLRYTLCLIVIDIAMLVFGFVSNEKMTRKFLKNK